MSEPYYRRLNYDLHETCPSCGNIELEPAEVSQVKDPSVNWLFCPKCQSIFRFVSCAEMVAGDLFKQIVDGKAGF